MDIINEWLQMSGLERVLISLVFMLVAAVISRWQHADLEKEIGIATVRSFVQLIAIGFALELIFASDNAIWIFIALGVMLLTASRTSANRAKTVPHSFWIALIGIGVSSFITCAILIGFHILEFNAQNIIPIGGMVIGNAMTVCTLVMNRLEKSLHTERLQIEGFLALGLGWRIASLAQFQEALRLAMIPVIDTTKTVGLIKLPGAMTGMILAGASPIEAVQLQLIVMYMMVGASTLSGLITAYLVVRGAFTQDLRLRQYS